jgi:hypothetical protein
MSELFVFLAIGVLMWLLNVLLPVRRKRRQSQIPPHIGPQVPPVLPRARTLPPPATMSRRGTPLPTAPPPVATRQNAPGRLGSRREIRRSIVLMTILGPCRALDPPEPPR